MSRLIDPKKTMGSKSEVQDDEKRDPRNDRSESRTNDDETMMGKEDDDEDDGKSAKSFSSA